MTKRRNCCCDETDEIKVEELVLGDGRRAERHTSTDEAGNEVVELFAEEKRPLKLEKRIARKMKNIVAEETVETIKDGEVAHREVKSLEPKTPMQVVERIGVADHGKIVDGDYVRKDEIGKLVSDAVVDGVSALMESKAFTYQPEASVPSPTPIFRAQSEVAQNVEEKKKSDGIVNLIMVGIIVLQLAFFGYMHFMN